MKLTRFENLELAVRALGGSKAIARLAKEILTGKKDVSRDSIVAGEEGIYYISETGALTRVLINIVDKNYRGRFFKSNYRDLVHRGEFDDDGLVEQLHRYHLVSCSTIETAEAEGWRDKYKMSNRRDGRFYYRFISDTDVYAERLDQRLYPCQNCLNQLARRGVLGGNPRRSNFFPKEFFDYADADQMVGIKEYGQYGEQSVPNKYAVDWRLIASRYKGRIRYQCEGPNCRHRDLSSRSLRRYLHVHHKDMDKAHNDFSNLESLCILCHAEQPGHSHMKAMPQYKEYVRFIDERNPTSA